MGFADDRDISDPLQLPSHLTGACTMHWHSLSAGLLLPHVQHQQKQTNPHAQSACGKGIEEHECDKTTEH